MKHEINLVWSHVALFPGLTHKRSKTGGGKAWERGWSHVHQERPGIESGLISPLTEHQSMQFGGLISTSNVLQTGVKQVTVDTSHTLLWTMSHTLAKH